MPAARGLKRTASKASASAPSGTAPPKIKKKHGVQLEVPTAPSVRGRLLACGQGDVGQLGLGEDIMETTRFKFVSKLGNKIVEACAGGMHTVALDSDGKVWTFGCNDEGALGRQAEEFSVGAVSLPEPAVAVSAGDSHTAALLRNGDVYLWGSFRDTHGSMGLVCEGREGKSCREPIRLVLPEQAAAIASGSDHLLVLTVTGAVYTAGCGEQGQLGRLSQRSASRHARQGLSALLVPTQVTLKPAIRRVWAGSYATFVHDANSSKVLAWGLNNHNQLGITGAKKKDAMFTPLEADAFTSIVNSNDVDSWDQVSSGMHHSLAVDSNGTCYAVGRCEYGRLGLGEGSGDAEVLTEVPALKDKKCISVAATTSSSYCVTDNGEVYAWGAGGEGQLGTGSEEEQAAPRLVSFAESSKYKPLKVSAGGQHAILLVANLSDAEEEPTPAAVGTSQAQKPEPKPSKAKLGKAQKQPTDEAEITSTNSAEAMDVDETKKPEKKVNGEKEEPTPMETDEAEKPEDKPADKAADKPTDKKETPDKLDTETLIKNAEAKTGARKEAKPEAPKEVKPVAPKEAKPEAPKEAKPGARKEAKPEAPKEVKPVAPKEAKPEAPKEAKPEAPKEDKSITVPKAVAKDADTKREVPEPKPTTSDAKNATDEKKEENKPEQRSLEKKAETVDVKIPSKPEVADIEMAEKAVNGEGEAEKMEVVVASKTVVAETVSPITTASEATAL